MQRAVVAHAGQTIGRGIGAEAAHFTGVGREDPVALRLPRVGGGDVEAVGVEHDAAAEVGGEAVQGFALRRRQLVAKPRPDEQGLGLRLVDFGVTLDGTDHDFGGDARGKDGVGVQQAVEADEAGTGLQGSFGRQLGRAEHADAAGDDGDATGAVFEAVVAAPREPAAHEGGVRQHGARVRLRLGRLRAFGKRDFGQGDGQEAADEGGGAVGEHAGFDAADGAADVGADGGGVGLPVGGVESGGQVDGEGEAARACIAQGVEFVGEASDVVAQGASGSRAEQAVEDEEMGLGLRFLEAEQRGGDAGELGAAVGGEAVGPADAAQGDGQMQGGGEADGVSGVVALARVDDDARGVKVREFALPGREECGEPPDDGIHELQRADAPLGEELLLGGAYGGGGGDLHAATLHAGAGRVKGGGLQMPSFALAGGGALW